MANRKIQLHTPSGQTPAYDVFPLTVLSGIYGGELSHAGDVEYKIAPDGQIIEPYLVIMGNTNTSYDDEFVPSNYYVKPRYLPMLDVQNIEISGSTFKKYVVDHGYLDFIDANGKISAQYLPSYVDDVVNVTVFSGDIFPSSGDICIRIEQNAGGGTTYRFYQKTGNTWTLGGGDVSKIYIDPNATDNAIYRCVSGDPTTAVKISENPFVIDTTKTNGVYLYQDGSALKAMADVATRDRFGTVKIGPAGSENTNGVYLSINDGVISVGAHLASGTNAGTVITAGSTVAVTDLIDQGWAAASIVPTANFMMSYVNTAISTIVPVVNHASTAQYGVVRIAEQGNIDVQDGVISVHNASADTKGVVMLVDDMTVTGVSQKAVTAHGIETYVTGLLAQKQDSLTEGLGILLSGGTISVRTTGPVTFSGNAVTVTGATDTVAGVVAITNNESDITAGKTTITGGSPLTVTPKAVKDYVTLAIADIVGPASDSTAGVVYIKDIDTSDDGDSINTVPKAYNVKTYVAGAVNDLIADIEGGTVHGPQITTSTGFADTDTNGAKVATVTAISGYIDQKLSETQHPIAAGTGIDVTQGTSVDTVSVLYGGAITTSALPNDAGTAIVVPMASASVSGAVVIGDMASSYTGAVASYTVPTVSNLNKYLNSDYKANYVDASNGQATGNTFVPLGGVRVWNSGGIQVVSGVLSLKAPTATTYGGVMLTDANALILDNDHRLKIVTKSPMKIDQTSSALAIDYATTTESGAVIIQTANDTMSDAAKVPTAGAVGGYITTVIGDVTAQGSSGVKGWVNTNYQKKLSNGVGIDSASLAANTVKVNFETPIVSNGSAIKVQTASGGATPELLSTALGAVWVRTEVRAATTISSDTKAPNTVPTEQAVRTLVDGLHYLDYTIVD